MLNKVRRGGGERKYVFFAKVGSGQVVRVPKEDDLSSLEGVVSDICWRRSGCARYGLLLFLSP